MIIKVYLKDAYANPWVKEDNRLRIIYIYICVIYIYIYIYCICIYAIAIVLTSLISSEIGSTVVGSVTTKDNNALLMNKIFIRIFIA